MFITIYTLDNRASAAITNILPSDANFAVVSADPPVAGSFSSPNSYAYLYVPTSPVGVATVDLTINSISNGRLYSAGISPIIGGVCQASVASVLSWPFPNNGWNTPQNLTTPNNHATEEFTGYVGGVATTYKVYCVVVNTSDVLPVGQYSNVTFKMSTTPPSLIGTFPGPVSNKGTGYFASNGAKWDTLIDFAPPCGSDVWGASNPVELYDLDNGWSQVPNVDVYIIEYDRNGVYRGSPWLAGDVTYKATGFGVNLFATDGGNYAPYNNNFTWSVYPGIWRADSRYAIGVQGIGQNNKIRIRLPFDQINSAITCPSPPPPKPGCMDNTALNFDPTATVPDNATCIYNTPPTGSITANCVINPGLATGTVTVTYNVTDINGHNLDLALSNGVTANSNTGSTTARSGNFPTFTANRQAGNQSVTGTVNDGYGSISLGSATFTCTLPTPPTVTLGGGPESNCDNLRISFTSSEAFTYSAELLIDGASAAPPITQSNLTAGNNYDFSEVALYKDFVGHNFSVRVTNSALPVVNGTSGSRNFGACAIKTCGPTFNPSTIEVSSTFIGSFNFIVSNFGPRGSTSNASTSMTSTFSVPNTVDMSLSGGGPPVAVAVSSNVNPSVTRAGLVANTAGLIPVSVRVTGLGAQLDCSYIVTVYNHPYVRAYGNDVIACAQDVEFHGGYNGALGPDTYLGAASQLAIFATNQITGMMSGSQDNVAPNLRVTPWDLSFANNVAGTFALTSLRFGGGVAGANCINSTITTTPTVPATNFGSSLDSLNTSGVYNWTGGENGNINGRINNGVRAVMYSATDVTLGNNSNGVVEYQSDSWSSAGDIPSFTLIVNGNIYIDESVTRLDGHYIATGDIYTCSTGNAGTIYRDLTTAQSEPVGSKTKSNFIVNSCRNQLVVNGSFKARNIHFLRSLGTVSGGSAYEAYSSGNIAEVFRFSPEIYLANGSGLSNGTGSGSNTSRYDSIVSRPPSY